jgi:hypothetical protein
MFGFRYSIGFSPVGETGEGSVAEWQTFSGCDN